MEVLLEMPATRNTITLPPNAPVARSLSGERLPLFMSSEGGGKVCRHRYNADLKTPKSEPCRSAGNGCGKVFSPVSADHNDQPQSTNFYLGTAKPDHVRHRRRTLPAVNFEAFIVFNSFPAEGILKAENSASIRGTFWGDSNGDNNASRANDRTDRSSAIRQNRAWHGRLITWGCQRQTVEFCRLLPNGMIRMKLPVLVFSLAPNNVRLLIRTIGGETL